MDDRSAILLIFIWRYLYQFDYILSNNHAENVHTIAYLTMIYEEAFFIF